jgi:osmotically inducible lipoprotein OsmB
LLTASVCGSEAKLGRCDGVDLRLETTQGDARMKKILSAATAIALALSVSACYSPGDRAAGGAAIGGLTGAAVGAAASGGRVGGTLAGAAIGAAGGALVGASTAPCPYGTYTDYYGNVYCR